MDRFIFKDMTLTWLEGGITLLDGGAMFGVVPKPVWSKRYPVNEKNQIELPTDPILIQYQNKNYLIDAGIGNHRLTEKQRMIFGAQRESEVEESLAQLNLTPEDIDYVLMTHMHFDHATGLSKLNEEGQLVSAFPNAIIMVQKMEWQEMQQPNIRSKSTYWSENWQAISSQVVTFGERVEIIRGIEMIHTGGHSKGHSIIKLTQGLDTLLHMADIMPTHAHQNPLWVMAYDDYPMTSIYAKEKLLKEAYQEEISFIFYHDAFYRMVQWDKEGKEIVETLKRSRPRIIK